MVGSVQCRAIVAGSLKLDIETMNRSRPEQPMVPEDLKDLPRVARRPVAVDADAAANHLLRDAAREAGLFQRSALGHLDHKDWSNRVRADGQRLINLLCDMGFSPSDTSGAKLTQ